MMDEAETVCVCKKNIKSNTIIVGFPGHGLVGSIAAKYIVQEMDMDVVGYIRSPKIPPLAVFLDGILAYPYRIYGKDGVGVSVLIGESPAPVNAYYYLANAALNWADSTGAKEIICLDGFPDMPSTKSPVFLVKEKFIHSKETEARLEEIKLPLPQTGYIGGLSGAILNESLLREIDGYALLAGTVSQMPDPAGAAALIRVINRIKNLEIDVEKLMQDGEKIRKSMQEFADKTQQITDMTAGPRDIGYI
ncbi:MAG: proteasome assembly chaperone family protein [Candidatus Odinarchaeota archaeon]